MLTKHGILWTTYKGEMSKVNCWGGCWNTNTKKYMSSHICLGKRKKKKVIGFWQNVSHLIIVSPLSCFPITNILLHFRSIITNSPLLGFLSLSLIRMQNLSPLYPSDTNIFTGVISKILFLQSFFILHILSYSSWFPIS